MGDVVLLELLHERKLLPAWNSGVDLFVIIEEGAPRTESLRLIQDLRRWFNVDYALTPMKADKQLKRALELNATATVKLEWCDRAQPALRFRSLTTREETTASRLDELLQSDLVRKSFPMLRLG